MIPARDLKMQHEMGYAARRFIARNHYSQKCPPSSEYFCATHKGKVVGAMAFRKPSLPSVSACYKADLELSRLVFLDAAGKNSESRFIAFALRWLRKHRNYRRVVSFADPYYGHGGVVYRAANFTDLGLERGHGTRVLVIDGVEVQAKTAYDRWGRSGKNLQELLPGKKVEVINRPKKRVYVFDLMRRKRDARRQHT